MLHDPEESHDCFSDNTHNSHFYDAMGIQNVYLGRYVRTDGSMVSGLSLSGLVVAVDPALDQEVRGRLEATAAAMTKLKKRAETVEHYDQMIGQDNPEGKAEVEVSIDALTAQPTPLETVVARVGQIGRS